MKASQSRTLQPVVDVHGRIILWKCSGCRWTHPLTATFTGLEPTADVLNAFGLHNCEHHRRSTTIPSFLFLL
jgi:hypothetical protein